MKLNKQQAQILIDNYCVDAAPDNAIEQVLAWDFYNTENDTDVKIADGVFTTQQQVDKAIYGKLKESA